MNGYILLSRSLVESDIWTKPPIYQKVWIYLLIKAQFQPYRELERGQLFTSISEIQKDCYYYVGYRKETPTKDQIYKVLRYLRSAHESNNESGAKAPMIAIAKATHGMVVTICNFNTFQEPNTYESNNESDTKATTKDLRKITPTNNINEEDNKKNKKNKKIEDSKHIYGSYKNVRLSDEDIQKLINEFPNDYRDRIEKLSEYIASSGKHYANHLATMRNWAKRDKPKEDKSENARNDTGNEKETREDGNPTYDYDKFFS